MSQPNYIRIVRAPFNKSQVRSLNDYQASPLHPYTCTVNAVHPPLVASKAGLLCIKCGYLQKFAHRPMTDRQWEIYLVTHLPEVLRANDEETH